MNDHDMAVLREEYGIILETAVRIQLKINKQQWHEKISTIVDWEIECYKALGESAYNRSRINKWPYEMVKALFRYKDPDAIRAAFR